MRCLFNERFQKNTCHHRILQNSPCTILLGCESKVSLSSTLLHLSIINKISTEKELKTLQLDCNLSQQDRSGDETKDEYDSSVNEHTKCTQDDDNLEDNNTADSQDSINILNEESILSQIRIETTALFRKDAKEGQKRQADQFLQATAKSKRY